MNKLIITIDVESDKNAVNRELKSERGVKEGIPKFIRFLKENGYPATFFISCDILNVLDKNLLIKNKNLFEIASHGFDHPQKPNWLIGINENNLYKNIIESKMELNRVFKVPILGFRAPGLRINKQIMKIIIDYYKYDSSMIINGSYNGNKLNIFEPFYVNPDNICSIGNSSLLEVPVSSIDLKFKMLPAIGAYIRVLPSFLLYNFNYRVIVLDLHCQDCIKFENWKYLTARNYFKKLKKILEFYERKGYVLKTMNNFLKNEFK